MNEQIIAASLGLVFAIFLVWLLRPRRRSVDAGAPIDRALENALPKHYQFFPQIRQALSAKDDQYLRDLAPRHIAQQVIRERRAVARHFLRGLREDFSNLERLARIVASLSPALSRQQEAERILLGLQFHFLYALVLLRLSLGRAPLDQIEHMTELIGRFALRMEQAMAEISALSTDRLTRGVSV